MTSRRTDQKQRILVVGCGSIGQRHIRNLLELGVAEVLAFDVREDRRREVENQNVQVLANLEEAWKKSPDAVVIAVPPSLHIPLALEAANHGCHLFIEKPLADGVQNIRELLEVVGKKRLVTLVGCNMRFHPGLILVKQLLDEEAVGRIVSASAAFGQYLPDWHPWEDYRQSYSARRDLGGGIILDAIHELDYMRWLLGEIQSVVCFAGNLGGLDIETEDTAGLLLRFAGGAIGEIHLDYVQRAYSRTCQIVGDQGTIHWDYVAREVRWYSSGDRKWRVIPDPRGWEPNRMYLEEMRHFLRCLDGNEKAALDAFEGKRVLEVALAAKASFENRQIVEL
jgi:predicted dehydrogenase